MSILIFSTYCQVVFWSVPTNLHSLWKYMKCLLFLIFTNLGISRFLFAILMVMKWCVIVVLIFISLLMEHLFQICIRHPVSFSLNFTFLYSLPIFVLVVDLFFLLILGIFKYVLYANLYLVWSYKYLMLVYELSFHYFYEYKLILI